MRRDDLNTTAIFLAVSLVIFFSWGIWAFTTRSEYQTIASVDPLAMIHVLFPWFWILILAFAFLNITVFLFAAEKRQLHVLLLIELSLFLHLTPFLLSGFSWSPDSLWHGGVAGYMPEILNGSKIAYSSYAQSYPTSFMITYVAEQVSGFNVFSYTLYVYPLLSIIAITVLVYAFASRFLNARLAFVSMLLTLPALHYFEPHVSPFSLGTILTLVSLLLLTVEGKIARALAFLTAAVLVLTHPISPISLGVFLVTFGVLSIFHKSTLREKAALIRTRVPISLLLFIGVFWIEWTMGYSISVLKPVQYSISDVISLRFLGRLAQVSQFTGGESFIYPWIYRLTLAIYAVFLIFISIMLISSLFHIRFRRETDPLKDDRVLKQLGLAISSILYAVLGYVLYLASNQHFLLGRGLLFYVMLGSMCVALFFLWQEKKAQRLGKLSSKFLAAVLIFFLLFSFPIIAYSKEAYNTFTPSSGYGLRFIASKIDLSSRSLSMSVDQQLASYVNLSRNVLISEYPPTNNTNANFIVLRMASYYADSMRSDLSFENNQYTRLRERLGSNMEYGLIYSSPTFEAYSLSGN